MIFLVMTSYKNIRYNILRDFRYQCHIFYNKKISIYDQSKPYGDNSENKVSMF